MKNRILAIFSQSIPYFKELRALGKTALGCIVMQQLDFRFAAYPSGFYKFLEPCQNALYRDGDSWTEELGFTPDEFRYAFDVIGTRYTSKTAYMAAEDKFDGKYYCSYFDKQRGVTMYFRNHALLDKALDELVAGTFVPSPRSRREGPVPKAAGESDLEDHGFSTDQSNLGEAVSASAQSTGDGNSNLQEMAIPISRDGNSNLPTCARSNAENTAKNNLMPTAKADGRVSAPASLFEQSPEAIKGTDAVPETPKDLAVSIARQVSRPKHRAADFEATWALYPHKAGRKEACLAWDKLKPDAALVATIRADIEARTKAGAWPEDVTKIVYFCRYLKNERWTDVLALAPAPARSASVPATSAASETVSIQPFRSRFHIDPNTGSQKYHERATRQ